jgi:hypothetical protein
VEGCLDVVTVRRIMPNLMDAIKRVTYYGTKWVVPAGTIRPSKKQPETIHAHETHQSVGNE